MLAYTQVESGAEFARTNQPDEYVVFVPDRDGPSLEITAGGADRRRSRRTRSRSSRRVTAASTVTGTGQVVRLFSVRAEDLLARCSNADFLCAAASERRSPRTLAGPGGRLQTARLQSGCAEGSDPLWHDLPLDQLHGQLWRRTVGPRDTRRMSPHSHDDFEQCSLVLQGEYVHHIRFPWTANLEKWIDDDHTRIGSPSIAIIPPPSIHTSQSIGSGRNQLIDIFSPPRFDLSEKEGWVLNAADYPMPAARGRAHERSSRTT